MELIPVIDIRGGITVRAVAGERQRYRPLTSRWTDSTEPTTVLRALRQHIDCERGYVADLDAIESRGDVRTVQNRCTIAELVRTGCPIILDAGAATARDCSDWLDLGVAQVIVSTESLPDMSAMQELVEECGAERLIFSLDLRQGAVIARDPKSARSDPCELVRSARDAGIRSVIVLDLAAVGVGAGLTTLDVCGRIHAALPDVEVITGGGVRSAADLEAARATGVRAVLVASALHDGRLLS